MPKPQNKTELIATGQAHYQRLMALVDGLSSEELVESFPVDYMNRNVRDVLAHLHHWHVMMKGWYEVGMSGEKPAMPAPGFSWKETAALNREIQQAYQSYRVEEVKSLLHSSFLDMQRLIADHDGEEMFEKKRYPWTGSTSLGAYLISNTSSHYDWAYKLIKKARRQAAS